MLNNYLEQFNINYKMFVTFGYCMQHTGDMLTLTSIKRA